MQNAIIEYALESLRNTNVKKTLNNYELDSILQLGLNIPALGDGKVRAIIHEIRTKEIILNDNNEEGWICGGHDGYWLTYNPYEILKHLEQFEGKIKKMMLVHRIGMKKLTDKLYYKQLELFPES